MFTACVAGATGQFYPMPFPQSRPLLAVCVVIYFGLSAVYQYLTWFVERDCVWQSKPSVRAGARISGINSNTYFDSGNSTISTTV